EGVVDLGGDATPAKAGVVIERQAPPTALQPPASERVRPGMLRALDERGNVRALADVEFEMIRLAIDHYNGQMSEVARRLGIGRSTLYRKLKEYGIDPETGRSERLAS
ncbi:helix-turn-helix domain-containing protein, partial [Aminobacter aminovorans]